MVFVNAWVQARLASDSIHVISVEEDDIPYMTVERIWSEVDKHKQPLYLSYRETPDLPNITNTYFYRVLYVNIFFSLIVSNSQRYRQS